MQKSKSDNILPHQLRVRSQHFIRAIETPTKIKSKEKLLWFRLRVAFKTVWSMPNQLQDNIKSHPKVSDSFSPVLFQSLHADMNSSHEMIKFRQKNQWELQFLLTSCIHTCVSSPFTKIPIRVVHLLQVMKLCCHSVFSQVTEFTLGYTLLAQPMESHKCIMVDPSLTITHQSFSKP